MVAVQKSAPKELLPYIFHGVSVDWQNPVDGGDGKQYAMGTCPYCSKEDKFKIEIATGVHGCFKCQIEKHNIYHFLRWLHEQSIEATTEYNSLSTDRKLLNGVGLASWEICQSVITKDWLIPGYSVAPDTYGHLCQLYRYSYSYTDKRMVTFPTPGISHYLHGINLFDPEKLIVFLCEGWSDGVALWEILAQTKETEGKYTPTSNLGVSLLSDANVIAAPTASIFNEAWCGLLKNKVVNIMYDNDHQRTHTTTKKIVDGAGLHHTKRIAKMLVNSDTPPEQINWLAWSDIGYNQGLPSGYDVRDKLSLTDGELSKKLREKAT